MFNHIWKKYLPIIKILLKKSFAEEQILDLNRIDFERAGTARKAGYKFKIKFINGKVGNVISGSPLATQLAQLMLEDEAIKDILKEHNVEISLNTKFQLIIHSITKEIVQ